MQFLSGAGITWTPRGFASHDGRSTLNLNGSLANVLVGLRGLDNPNAITTVNINSRFQRFSSAEVCAVMDVLADLQKLSNLHLDLVCSGLCDDGANALGVGAAKLDELAQLSLNLGYCNIGGVGTHGLASGLTCRLTSLRLHLNKNQIDTSGIEGLAAALAKMRQLSHLDFSFWGNKTSAVHGAEYFASVLTVLYPLTGYLSMGEYARTYNGAYQTYLSTSGLI